MILNSNPIALRRFLAMPATALLEQPPRTKRGPMPAETISLLQLSTRQRARIVRVAAEANDAARLMALGICVGRQVEVVRAGDPLIVSVVGARVGISSRLAAGVTVQIGVVAANSPMSAAG
jgi:Fe2+ transport system protein FeoA